MTRSKVKYLVFLALVALAIWALLPLWLTIQTSFLAKFVIVSPLRALQYATLENWSFLPVRLIAKWLKNSIIVCGSITALVTFMSALAGFSFAKYEFPGRDKLFGLFLLAMVVPGVMIFLPKFLITVDLRLYNSYLGMIMPGLVAPSAVFLSRQYFMQFPDDVSEAARLDGASEFQIFRYIIIPLSFPLLAIISLTTFLTGWGDFMWQLLVVKNVDLYTVVMGLGMFLSGLAGPGGARGGGELLIQGAGRQVNIEGLQAAASIILAIPPLILFVIGQKYFLKGLVIGAAE